MAAAAMEASVDTTVQYVRDRKAFGKPVGVQQNTRFVLAELATKTTTVCVFVDRCIELLNQEKLTVEQAAMAKWWSTIEAQRSRSQP